MWHIPVLRPGFPLFFQHGQPEGLWWGRAIVLFWLGSFCWEATLLYSWFYCSSTDSSSGSGWLSVRSCAGDVRAGSSSLGPVWAFVVGSPGQCVSSYRPPGWPPSSSSPDGALRGLPGPCRAWTVKPLRVYHAACCCGPSPCVGDGVDDWNQSSHALPQVWGLILGTSVTGPNPQDPDASTSFLLYGSSITLGVARTGLHGCHFTGLCLPARFTVGCPTGPHGPWGRFAGPFPGSPSPVPPPTFPAPDPNMHPPPPPPPPPPPCAFVDFFRVPRPLLSRPPEPLRHRPPQLWTLWIPRCRRRIQWPFPRALPRKWSKVGRKNSWSTWNPIGNSLSVTLHLSKQWVPLFHLRTWAPTRCGSWVTLTTERHHRLSVRPGQNEQTVASVKAVDPARGPLLTDIGLGSGTAKCLLTPPPRPDACLLPPKAHGWTIVTSPVRPVPQKVVSVLHGPAVLGYPAHHFHAVVVPRPLLHLTTGPGIARLPLVGLSGPAWLGGMLGVHPCRHPGDHMLLIGGHDDHSGPPVIPSVPDQGP